MTCGRSLVSVCGLAVVAVVVGVAGSFVHLWASPLGLLLAVGGAGGVAVLARVAARSRIGPTVIGLLWLVPVMVFAQPRGGSSAVVNGDEAGLVFLFGGCVCHAIAVGMGAEARSTRHVT